MMPIIWLNKEACEYVERAHSKLYSGTLSDGSAYVEVKDVTLQMLKRHMLPYEDYSDIIIRIAREALNKKEQLR